VIAFSYRRSASIFTLNTSKKFRFWLKSLIFKNVFDIFIIFLIVCKLEQKRQFYSNFYYCIKYYTSNFLRRRFCTGVSTYISPVPPVSNFQVISARTFSAPFLPPLPQFLLNVHKIKKTVGGLKCA